MNIPDWYLDLVGDEVDWIDAAYYSLGFSNWPGAIHIRDAFTRGGWLGQPISLHEAIAMACIEQDRKYHKEDVTS